jgi:ribosomal protein S18 acetylase RimI-like enzyme
VTHEIRVTEATADDVAAIGAFFRRAWEEAGPGAAGFSGATEEVIAEISAPDAIRARVGGPERRMFVAWEGTDVVGFAATRRLTAGAIELAGVVVLQSMVGRGIGTPLVAAAIASAQGNGFTTMTVSTETDNERALGFYQARGFRLTGQSTADADGVDVEVWNLELSL